MQVETRYLRLFRAVGLGDDMDGWQVCWLGGWDKCRIVFLVMVKRVTTGTPGSHCGQGNMSSHEGCVAAAMRLGDAKKTP
jgi:hypothetical protein